MTRQKMISKHIGKYQKKTVPQDSTQHETTPNNTKHHQLDKSSTLKKPQKTTTRPKVAHLPITRSRVKSVNGDSTQINFNSTVESQTEHTTPEKTTTRKRKLELFDSSPNKEVTSTQQHQQPEKQPLINNPNIPLSPTTRSKKKSSQSVTSPNVSATIIEPEQTEKHTSITKPTITPQTIEQNDPKSVPGVSSPNDVASTEQQIPQTFTEQTIPPTVTEPEESEIPPTVTEPHKPSNPITAKVRKSPRHASPATDAATTTKQREPKFTQAVKAQQESESQQKVTETKEKKITHPVKKPHEPSKKKQKKQHPSTTTSKTKLPVKKSSNSGPEPMTKAKLKDIVQPDLLSHIPAASSPTDLDYKFKYKCPLTVDWDTLEKLNVKGQILQWLTPAWKKLFEIKHPVYKKLTHEFFSTFKFNKQTTTSTNVNTSPAMTFSLRGTTYALSFKQFAVAMNLYTEDEVKAQDFGSGLTEWPSDVDYNEFWSSFGEGVYGSNTSCTSIKKHPYKILHRLISESISQRGTCTNLVTQRDMFYMMCLVQNRPCNVVKCLARYLYGSRGKVERSAVCGGAYVTQLALGLGAYTVDELDHMEQLASPVLMDEAQLKRLLIVAKDAPLRFLEPAVDSVKNAQAQPETIAELSARVTAMEGEIHWMTGALYFLIQQLGHSFEAPPHMKARANGSDPHNNSAAPDAGNGNI